MTLDKLKRSNFQFFIVNKNLKKATTIFFFANVVALFNNTHLPYIASQPGVQEANLRQTVSPDSRSHTHPRIYIITYGTRQLSYGEPSPRMHPPLFISLLYAYTYRRRIHTRAHTGVYMAAER